MSAILMPESLLMTYEDVARELQVDQRTVKRYVQAGKLKVLRISRKNVRIARADFQRFLRSAGLR